MAPLLGETAHRRPARRRGTGIGVIVAFIFLVCCGILFIGGMIVYYGMLFSGSRADAPAANKIAAHNGTGQGEGGGGGVVVGSCECECTYSKQLAYTEFTCVGPEQEEQWFGLVSYSCCDTLEDGVCTPADDYYRVRYSPLPEQLNLATRSLSFAVNPPPA